MWRGGDGAVWLAILVVLRLIGPVTRNFKACMSAVVIYRAGHSVWRVIRKENIREALNLPPAQSKGMVMSDDDDGSWLSVDMLSMSTLVNSGPLKCLVPRNWFNC